MKKTLAFATAVVFVFVLVSGISAAGGEDLSGVWIGHTEVPDVPEPVEMTLTLEKSGDSYIGTVSDSAGMLMDAEAEDLELDGDTLSFTLSLADEYETTLVYITLTVEDDTMTGYWEVDSGESAEIVLKKQRD